MFPSTRPRPFFRLLTQTSLHRVAVKVIDLLMDDSRFVEVAIVSASPLPKSIVDISIRLLVSHLLQKCWCMFAHPEQCSFGNRLFHRVQEFADVVGCQRRVDENMGMFRHDDVSPEVICVQLSGTIQSIEHPVTTTILAQKRSSLKTRKGEGMSMARFVVSLTAFAV